MSKLTKAQAKLHEHACALLQKDVLSFDDRDWHGVAPAIESVRVEFATAGVAL